MKVLGSDFVQTLSAKDKVGSSCFITELILSDNHLFTICSLIDRAMQMSIVLVHSLTCT